MKGWHLLSLAAALLLLAYPPVLRRWKAGPHYLAVEMQREIMAGRERGTVLAVTDQPSYLTAVGFSSIGIGYAREHPEFVAAFLGGSIDREALFFRYYDHRQKKPLDGYDLGESYALEGQGSFPLLRALSRSPGDPRSRGTQSGP